MSASVRDMLARATSRTIVHPGDARAGADFEKVVVDGAPYFVKRLSRASDWIMRVTGDHEYRPYLIWRAGIMERFPPSIDHAMVTMELDGEGEDAVLTQVMRDIGPWLVPEGDDVVPESHHQGFLTHMAELSATFWGWQDDVGLTTMSQRLRFFAPNSIAPELERADVPGPVAAADVGWKRLETRSPSLAALARAAWAQPELLTVPISRTPVTFVHGDWKMGNLGAHPDGRTILLDCAYPGSGPACWDLCWYLALNRARLPESKEASIERFRRALEGFGVPTDDWFEEQLDLCLMAMMVTFGWEKALGDDDELSWWERQVEEAASRRGITAHGVS